MQEKSSKIFARILIYPNHFDSGLISWRCFYPRSVDTDGISVFHCDGLTLKDLVVRGEQIGKTENKKSLEAGFYGILFFLGECASENFYLTQTGKHKYHYALKHKAIDYSQNPVQIDNKIRIGHIDLLNESILKTKEEIETLFESLNEWDAIYNELLDLANKI